jgi:hypothetical protein
VIDVRERDAYHAAGHAAVMQHLGIEFEAVPLRAVAGFSGWGVGTTQIGAELLRYGNSTAARAAAEPYIMATLAGALAEERRCGGYDETGTAADDRKALELALVVCADEEEARAYLTGPSVPHLAARPDAETAG